MAHILFIIHRRIDKEHNCAENRVTRTSSSPWSIQAPSIEEARLIKATTCTLMMSGKVQESGGQE